MRFVKIARKDKDLWVNLDRVQLIVRESTGYKLWYGTGEDDYLFVSSVEFNLHILPLLEEQGRENERLGA